FYRLAHHPPLHSFPTRRSSDLNRHLVPDDGRRRKQLPSGFAAQLRHVFLPRGVVLTTRERDGAALWLGPGGQTLSFGEQLRLLRSEEHTSELQSQSNLVCRLLL